MKNVILFMASIMSLSSVAKMTPSDVSLTMFRSAQMTEPTVFCAKVAISDWNYIGDAYQMRQFRDQYYAIRVMPIKREQNQSFTSFVCFAKKDGNVGSLVFNSLKDGHWHVALIKLRHSTRQDYENICMLDEIEIVESYKSEDADSLKENEIDVKFSTTRLSVVNGRNVDYLAGRIAARIKTKLKYIKNPVLRVVVLTEEAGSLEVHQTILSNKEVSSSLREWYQERVKTAKEISLEQTEVASSACANLVYSGVNLGGSTRLGIRGPKGYSLIGYARFERDKKYKVIGYRIEMWYKGKCVEFFDTIKQSILKKYELPEDWYVINKYTSKFKYMTLVGPKD